MKGKFNQPRHWQVKVPYKHIDGKRYVLKMKIEAISKKQALDFGLREAVKKIPTNDFNRSEVKIKRC